MPRFWEPPSKTDTKPGRRLQAEHGMDGLEYPQPHILSSPPGTRAPIHLINYTPKTGEVHGPGVPAPEHELNYSLMPHDGFGAGADAPPMGTLTPYLSGAPPQQEALAGMVQPSWVAPPMGMGADMAPGIGQPPGGDNLTGRYGNAATMRSNTFSPGQPPLSPTPYGLGPGPRLQASGPAVRPFEQRGSSMGNASTFGQDTGSFGGGFGAGADRGMGAGQTARPKQDFAGTADDVPDASKGRITGTPQPLGSAAERAAAADAAGGTDPARGGRPSTPAVQTQQNLPSNLPPAPSGYKPQVIYAPNEFGDPVPTQVMWIPDPPGPGKKPVLAGWFVPGEQPDRITGMPKFQPMDAATRKELEGSGKDTSRTQVVTRTAPDGTGAWLSLIDLDTGNEIRNLGPKPADESADRPKMEVPGDIKVQGQGSGQIALRASKDGKTWVEDPEWTAKLRAAWKADEDAKENAATERQRIAANAQMATAGIYTVFTDASGQTWLLNENKGTKEQIGEADLSKGTMTVDNNVIKLGRDDSGKVTANVVYSAPRDRKVDTVNGKTIQYDPRDPKNTWEEITEDKYYERTQEQALAKGAADIDKIKADTAKIQSDVLNGKITNIEAKVKLAKLAYDTLNPEPTIYSTGDFYLPEGGELDVHYMDEGTKRFGSKDRLSPDRKALVDRIYGWMDELDQTGKPAASAGGGGATGGGPTAASTATSTANQGDAGGSQGGTQGGDENPYPWLRADQAAGTTPKGDEMAEAGRAGTVKPGDPNYLGTKATPEQIEKAKRDWERQQAGLPPEEEEEPEPEPEPEPPPSQNVGAKLAGWTPKPAARAAAPAKAAPLDWGKQAVEQGLGGWKAAAEAEQPWPGQAGEAGGPPDPNTVIRSSTPASTPVLDWGAQARAQGLGGWNAYDEEYGAGQDVNDEPGPLERYGQWREGNHQRLDEATGGKLSAAEEGLGQLGHAGLEKGLEVYGGLSTPVRNAMMPAGEQTAKLGTWWNKSLVDPEWRRANIPNPTWGATQNFEQAVNAEPIFGGPGSDRVARGMALQDARHAQLLEDAAEAGIGKQWWHNLPAMRQMPEKQLGEYAQKLMQAGPKALMSTFTTVGPDVIPQYVIDSMIDQFLAETGAADWRQGSPNYGKSMYGVGQDEGPERLDPGEGNWYDIDPKRYYDFIDWLRKFGEEHQAPQPQDKFWEPTQPGIGGGGGDIHPPADIEDLHGLARGVRELGRSDPEQFQTDNAPRGTDQWGHEPSIEGDTQYGRDPSRAERTTPSDIARRRDPVDVFEQGHEAYLERQGGDPDAYTNADDIRRTHPEIERYLPPNFDEWHDEDQDAFVQHWLENSPAAGEHPPEPEGQTDADVSNEDLQRRYDEALRALEDYKTDSGDEPEIEWLNPGGWDPIKERPQEGKPFIYDPNRPDKPPVNEGPARWPLGGDLGWEHEAPGEDWGDRNNAGEVEDLGGGHRPPIEIPEIKAPDWWDELQEKLKRGGGHIPGAPPTPPKGHVPGPEIKLPGHTGGPGPTLPGLPGLLRFGAGQEGEDMFARLSQQLSEQNAMGAGQGPEDMQALPPDPNDPTGGALPGVPPDIESLRAQMGGAPQGAPGMTPPGGPGGMPGAPSPPSGAPGWTPPVPEGDVAGIGHRFGQEMNQGEPFHSGVDLQALEGTDTIAPEDGIVEDVRNDPQGLGLTVIVRDKNGMQHKLGHLKDTRAYRGMVVAKGQNLARVGSSGNTTGSHLHWAVKDQSGQPQDPTPALGAMGSLPPVPGTEMMGPPGGSGSPPGAAGAPSGQMPSPGAPPMPGQPPQGMGNDMGAGADGGMGAGAGDLGITPSQQAQINNERKKADQDYEVRMAEIAQRREAAKWEHEDRLAKIESDWKIHQDEDRRQQEINAENARHNQQEEAIERERIQADKDIQAMKDATEIKLQQMQAGNQIYLQQGQQAFADWQATQKARLDILGSALKNPWLQRLSGMTPGAGYNKAAVGGQNIQDLMNQILQPYDPTKWGAQNAPSIAGLGGTTAGGPEGGAQNAGGVMQQTAGGPQTQGGGGYAGQNVEGVDWNTWQGWDPFQKAAYRANTEALGPGAWEQVGGQLAEDFTASGGNENVTRMQAAGGGEVGRAGMEMTADVLGQAPQQFWQNQNRQWSKAAAPGVKQNLAGAQQGY